MQENNPNNQNNVLSHFTHETVFLQETIDAVMNHNSKTVEHYYLDGTFGRGGHTRKLLKCLQYKTQNQNSREKKHTYHVYGVDQDPQAIEYATKLEQENDCFTSIYGNTANILNQINPLHQNQFSGILLDLGVSSPQLDDPTRGFSFRFDGPLDMRMNHHDEQTQTVAQWLNTVDLLTLKNIIETYGEERYATLIAAKIIETRTQEPLHTTQQLATLIQKTVGHRYKKQDKHPATRTFQALRIFINQELELLPTMLENCWEQLAVGGRLAVISFHSLEDRIVKNFMKSLNEQEVKFNHHQYSNQAENSEHKSKNKKTNYKTQALLRNLQQFTEQTTEKKALILKKQLPTQEMIQQNPRCRSAILRVVEKI